MQESYLSGVPVEELRIFASRCALRVLPYALNYGFDYLDDVGADLRHYIVGLNLCAAGYPGALEVSKFIQSKAEAVVDPNDNITKSAKMASAVAAVLAIKSAIEAANAADSKSKNDIRLAAINAEKYASSAFDLDTVMSGPDVMRVEKENYSSEDIANLAAQAERTGLIEQEVQSLLDGKSLFGKPLWRTSRNKNPLQREVYHWLKFLEFKGMTLCSKNYQKILDGEQTPKFVYKQLYTSWVSGEPQELADREALSSKLDGYLSISTEAPSRRDSLGRENLVQSIAEILNNPDHNEPLTIGLLGDWGAGKTTMLNLLESSLGKSDKGGINYTVEVFNAWSYEHTESIQAGVAQAAILGLHKSVRGGWFTKVKLSLALQFKLSPFKVVKSTLIVIAWIIGVAYLAINGRVETIWDIGLGTALTLLFILSSLRTFFASLVTKEFITFLQLPDFTKDSGRLPIYQLQVEEFSKLCLKNNERMLFVVDDLDRCSPEGIVKVFEAIRLVMELNNVTVIIAIDHRVALSALAHHCDVYGDQGVGRSKYDIARDYLGKIIQLPISLDKPNQDMVDKYIASLFEGKVTSQKKAKIAGDKDNSNSVDDTMSLLENSKQRKSSSSVSYTRVVKRKGGASKFFSFLLGDPGKEIVEVKQTRTMSHSQAEKEEFTELAKLLNFHNPRQLKRLHSSYRLVRAYSRVNEGKNFEVETLKYLSALFFQEYRYCLGGEAAEICERDFIDYLNGKSTDDNIVFKHFGKVFLMREEMYLQCKRVVEPFVLPQISS